MPGNGRPCRGTGGICIHIGACGRAQGELFAGGRKPWCQPDIATDEEIEDVMLRCPTGALTVDYADDSRVEKPSAVNTVQVAYNGRFLSLENWR